MSGSTENSPPQKGAGRPLGAAGRNSARLCIETLGCFRVALDARPVGSFESDKVRALLAYLAVESDRPHRREKLVGLLWPEWPERSARSNLSQALFNLRAAVGDRDANPPYLIVTRQTLQFNRESSCSLDSAAFFRLIAGTRRHDHPDPEACGECSQRLQEAVTLYRGSFLDGFSLSHSAAFEEWVRGTRGELERLALAAHGRLADHYRAVGQLDAAVQLARQAVAIDCGHEESQRRLIALLALSGDRSAALCQYERFSEWLWREIGAEPADEIKSLFLRIQRGELGPQDIVRPAPNEQSRQRINLPRQLTPFVGREAELSWIVEKLRDHDCRLLTLVGPGGSGKTRLAIEAAQEVAREFEHGAAFVSLAPLCSSEAIIPTIAEALGFSFPGGSSTEGKQEIDQRRQLIDYLRRKNVLLIMDNFEHLLGPDHGSEDSGARLVSEILACAVDVTVLATSRSRLNVGGEQRYRVSGMAFPPPSADTGSADPELGAYDSVQLFLQTARRAVPGFELSSENVGGVAEICRLVEGIPLAVRLAAAWVSLLTPAEIAAEINRGLELLRTDVCDVPDRHRSMRAVLEHSWRTLTERQQDLMDSLSVFRGGFSREAAESVAGATLPDLMALTDKSLLSRTESGRYEIHEMTRAYAADRLDGRPEFKDLAHDRHAAHYAAALEQWGADLNGARQVAALEEIDRDIENARAVWNWAVLRTQCDRLDSALEGLCLYFAYRRRYVDLENICKLAAEALANTVSGVAPKPSEAEKLRVLAYVKAWQGYGLPDPLDRDLVQTSLDLLDRPEASRVDIRHVQAFALRRMGGLATDLDLGIRLCKQSLSLYSDLGDQCGIAHALLSICDRASDIGKDEPAEQAALQSLEIFRSLGHKRGMAKALVHLSYIAHCKNNLEGASFWAQQIIAIGHETRDRGLVADGLVRLAIAANASGQWARGLTHLQEAAAIHHELGLGHEAFAGVMCWTRVNLRQYAEALSEAKEQIASARECEDWPRVAFLLGICGAAALGQRDFADARYLFEETIEIVEDLGHRYDALGSYYIELSAAHVGVGDVLQARRCFQTGLQLVPMAGHFVAHVHAILGMAQILAKEGWYC